MSTFSSTVTPAQQLYYEPPHVRGDKEFDGNGPYVTLVTRLQITGTGLVSAVVDASFQETRSDWTTFAGSSSPVVLFYASGGLTFTTPSSDRLEFLDTNYTNDIFSRIGLVRRYEIVGDRDGGLFGGADKPSARIDLNPIRFQLSDAANYAYGGSYNDTLSGNDGNDTLLGLDGNDWLYGDNGNNYLLGGNGNDILYGNAGFISGYIGNDTLNGGNGNDRLDGEGGNDFLLSSQGNDSLTGGGGNDTLTGGTEADQFIFGSYRPFQTSELGIDTVTDFIWTQGDKISLGKNTFTALRSVAGMGFSVSSEFARVNNDAAATLSSAFIVYNTDNGKLFYNPNGSTIGFAATVDGGGHFATLTGNPFLIASDFNLLASV